MTIRKASKEDFPIIQKIANVVWPATFGPLMPPDTLTYMIDLMYSTKSLNQQVDQNNIQYLIIEEETVPVGYCSYELNYNNDQKLMVHRIYFLPEEQGKGYGTRVLKHLETICVEKQQKGLFLKVLHSNTKAFEYYLKYGFFKTGEDYNHVGNGYPPFFDYVLEKPV